jgi:hypothetical protein
MLPMSYRLSKPALRYEEEISTNFFVNKSGMSQIMKD